MYKPCPSSHHGRPANSWEVQDTEGQQWVTLEVWEGWTHHHSQPFLDPGEKEYFNDQKICSRESSSYFFANLPELEVLQQQEMGCCWVCVMKPLLQELRGTGRAGQAEGRAAEPSPGTSRRGVTAATAPSRHFSGCWPMNWSCALCKYIHLISPCACIC